MTQRCRSQRNLYGHLLKGLLRERRLEEVLLQEGCENAQLGMSLRSPRISIFHCMSTTQTRLGEASLAANLVGFKKMKNAIDVEESTPLIDQVISGCTQSVSVTTESDVKIKYDYSLRSQC